MARGQVEGYKQDETREIDPGGLTCEEISPQPDTHRPRGIRGSSIGRRYRAERLIAIGKEDSIFRNRSCFLVVRIVHSEPSFCRRT